MFWTENGLLQFNSVVIIIILWFESPVDLEFTTHCGFTKQSQNSIIAIQSTNNLKLDCQASVCDGWPLTSPGLKFSHRAHNSEHQR